MIPGNARMACTQSSRDTALQCSDFPRRQGGSFRTRVPRNAVQRHQRRRFCLQRLRRFRTQSGQQPTSFRKRKQFLRGLCQDLCFGRGDCLKHEHAARLLLAGRENVGERRILHTAFAKAALTGDRSRRSAFCLRKTQYVSFLQLLVRRSRYCILAGTRHWARSRKSGPAPMSVRSLLKGAGRQGAPEKAAVHRDGFTRRAVVIARDYGMTRCQVTVRRVAKLICQPSIASPTSPSPALPSHGGCYGRPRATQNADRFRVGSRSRFG